jgi:hypothetical protein
LVQTLSGGNPLLEFIIIDAIATILFGESFIRPEAPVSPTH